MSTAHSLSSSTSSLTPPSPDFETSHSGLPHSPISINARLFKRDLSRFKSQVGELLGVELRVEGWKGGGHEVKVKRADAAMTNSVFFISSDTAPTVLLRVYGPSSSLLISRPHELHVLHTLSSLYNIGPGILGTFKNGRVEQFFPSRPLSAAEFRSDTFSALVAERMADLHRVDLNRMTTCRSMRRQDSAADQTPAGHLPGVWQNTDSWLRIAKGVMAELEALTAELKPSCAYKNFVRDWNMPLFERQLNSYRRWVEDRSRGEDLVFCHNDAQPGNLLLLETESEKDAVYSSEHLVVVDFEYASPNPRGFDISNVFQEWRTDYNHETLNWSLDHAEFPSHSQRTNFYRGYVNSQNETTLENMDQEVMKWAPAPLAMWAIWSIVSAKDQVSTLMEDDVAPDFDCLLHSLDRLKYFRSTCKELGVTDL